METKQTVFNHVGRLTHMLLSVGAIAITMARVPSMP